METVAIFPAAFLSRSFTYLPGIAVTALSAGVMSRRKLAEPGVLRQLEPADERAAQILSFDLLGAGAVLAICAVVALVRAVARRRARPGM